MKRIVGALMAVVFLVANTSMLANVATAAPTTKAEETSQVSWPADQALPTFGTPAATLDAVRINTQSYDTRVIATTLQGIINRKQPRILVLNSSEEGNQTTWPNAQGLKLSQTNDLDGLVKKYKDELKGTIIYDASRMDTINVATTLAGIYDCIVVSPTMAERYESQSGLKVKLDLRTAIPASATSKLDIYNWLYENYHPGNTKGNPSYNPRLVVGLNPGNDAGAIGDNGHVAARDVATAMKAPVIWLDPGRTGLADDKLDENERKERELLKKFTPQNLDFDKADSTGNAYFMGWWPSEERGIRWATEQGWPTVPSDNFENYSVYSGLSKEVNPPETPEKPELENKIYVSVIVSDGDNIAYNEHAMRTGRLWGDRNRGQVPITWTITPALLDAAPQMLEYYYKTATPNDNLVCGPSGIGYTRASNWWQPKSDVGDLGGLNNLLGSLSTHWPTEAFAKNYGALTNSYFERSNMNTLTIWRTITAQQANAFTSTFPALQGMTVMERNGSDFRTLSYTDSDAAIMYLGGGSGNKGMGLDTRYGNEANYMDSFKEDSSTYKSIANSAKNFDPSKDDPRFIAMQFSAWSGDISPTEFMNSMNKLQEEYPGKIEFVRLDHLNMLVNEFNGKPINAALQADASASGSDDGYDAAKAVDGTFAPANGWKSSADGDKWLTVDLGKRFNISRYVLKNAETGYYANNLNTKDYKIQASIDGVTWKDIDTVTGNTEDIVYRDATATARFVRVYITNPGADGVARIQDFEVYGTPVDTVKTELEQAIQQVEDALKSLDEKDYSATTWKALQDALTEAKRVNGIEATQIQVDDATAALKQALANLSADKTALKAAIDLAKSKTESDYSPASWSAMQEKLTKAETVYRDASSKQSAVDAAAQELNAAIQALTVDKTALKDAIDKVGETEKVESDYSKASWEAYKKALDNANALYNDKNAKQSAVDQAAKDLLDAEKKLTTDKSDLEAAIVKANALAQTDYSPASWDAMQKVLEEARKAYADSEIKQSGIDAALNDLNDAIGKLTTDKTALKASIEAASAKKESDYSKSSWNALKTALDRAKELDASSNAKQSEINAAVEALDRAVKELGIDKSELQAAIEKAAGKKQEDYSATTWNAMQDALKAAKEVNEKEAPVQSEIDAAMIKLTETINALSPDKDALKAVIDAASEKLESDYTADSWAILQEKLSEARAMFAGTDAVQSQVDQMEQELKAAIAALVKAPSDGENNGTGSNPITSDIALGAAALLIVASAGAFLVSKKRKNVK